ncbi:trypsin-like serine protease [Variovorax sp. PCZ-1]|uniref:trypsin-like serine protease n=1 Tax=Variovorax sp. PCZ-1 TaxID=2835533 RepID=UPI001BCBCF59|nr:trypsin-like serine protease [Variovorax sp. PCZ-1]MBS7807745.1 trypsin-like serine protease [Variovorax sp. PCZ-1]
MRHLIVALLAVASCTALSQPERLQLSPDGLQKLQELRLQKSKEFARDLPLSRTALHKLLETDDEQVIKSVLAARSTVPKSKLDDDAIARARLVALSRTRDVDLQKTLRSAGYSGDKLLETARTSVNPQVDVKALRPTISFNREGRAVFIKPSVLVTNPGVVAPDGVFAGMPFTGKPVIGSGEGKPVYRQGLRYAGLLAATRDGSYEMVCSGTVVAKYWLITAAHCLFNEVNSGRYPAAQLAVFMPLQGGQETVRGFNGDNRAMKRISVEAAVWMGDGDNSISFPVSKDGFGDVIKHGRDLAMLRLNQQQMDALPNLLGDVRLYMGTPPESETTVVGYGITDIRNSTGLTLLAGFRGELPSGADRGSNLLQFGKPGDAAAGICGGDSGGGLFLGRIDGTQSSTQLIGVISGLKADESSSAEVCIASAQMHSSLLSQRNRKFVCDLAPAACA